MDTEIPFVEKIRNRMKRIESTLTNQERLKYQSQIDMIYRLLDLFEDTGGVSKEIKKKLDEATKKISNVIKGQELITTKGMSPVKPNIDSLDLETMNKAKMVNASNVFLESNNNEDATNEALRGTKFKVDKNLSTDEGLVLTDDEGNVKISFRGTNTSYKRPIQSIKDLVADSKFITGTEQYGREGGELQSGRNLIQSAIDKYGVSKENMEILGHSLGGQKAILLGDEFGINTTTFNPLIGYNSMKASTTNAQHNMFRTTEDITSLGAGFATEKKNWNVKSILPKKISIDPRQAHKLNNFFDNEGRATESPLQKKVAKVIETGKRKAQVEDLNDTYDILSGIDDIPGIDERVMEQRLQMNYPSSSELLDESSLQEPTPNPDELIDTSDLQRRMANLVNDKPIRQQVFNPDDFKNKNARDMANMRKGRFEKFSIEGDPDRSEKLPTTKKFTGKGRDIDLGIFEPTEPDKTIKDISFDDITDFFRTNTDNKPNKINDFELSSLNDDEIDNLMTGSSKDRSKFEEITNNEFNDAVGDLDNHFNTISTENLESGGFGSDLVRSLHPSNLLGGLLGGVVSQEAVDFVDPDRKIQKQVRESLIGSGAGLLTSLASSSLGAGGGIAALGPEALAGGLGYLAGEETTEGVAKLTGSRAAGDVTGGLVGGGVGGLTLGLGTALATDIATGSAIGTAFDVPTLGLGTAIGAGVGAAIGGISYGLHKIFS